MPLPLADRAVIRPVAGQAPLARMVLDLLDAVPGPGDVVVVLAEPLVRDVRALFARDGLQAVSMAVVDASATRAQFLAAALEHVVRDPVSTHVLVHDVRQPLIPSEVRNRVVERLAQGAPVVLPVQPVTDSVKAVDESGQVIASLDRSTLQTVQFPRGFTADVLTRLLAGSAGEFDAGEFDEVRAAIRSSLPIALVDGDTEGFGADLSYDAPFLEAVIASRRAR